MTSITFGIRVPAGIFLPSIAIGSCIGRAMGICVSALQQTYPLFFLFSGCPVDGPCVSPTVYAVIGWGFPRFALGRNVTEAFIYLLCAELQLR